MQKFTVKPDVYYSAGALDSLKFGAKRVFLVIDPFMEKEGYGEIIKKQLNHSAVEFKTFSTIQPDSPIENVMDGVSAILDFQPDLIIALGGGSAIDTAKAIVFFYKKISVDNKVAKFAAIPTTSGTGSEVTSFSVITVDGKKIALTDDSFLPDIAIIDANFTKNLPLAILADTSLDALTHALEAYLSKNDSDCTDALCEKAIKLIFKYLTEIFVEGDSFEARERLHNASCIAGMAFNNASLGLNHSMAHALGGIFHTPHGRSNAVFLTTVLTYNSTIKYVKNKLANLALELNLKFNTKEEAIEAVLQAVENLIKITNTPVCVGELGIPFNVYIENLFELANRAENDICTATNPVTPTNDELTKLFIKAYGIRV